MKYTSTCVVLIFFVQYVPIITAQRNPYTLTLNKYQRGHHANKFQSLENHNNNNPFSNGVDRNFQDTRIQHNADKMEQQRILQQLIKLLFDFDKGVKRPSPAAKIARQRPFALVSPQPKFLRCTQNCPTTNQYNPVCGTDYQTYHNEFQLQCAIRCGKNIRMNMVGICPLDF